ncbi:hypothetical protein BH24ACT14_BH24ACT14_18450 [soil metagenome]|jgi:hypothetical protein
MFGSWELVQAHMDEMQRAASRQRLVRSARRSSRPQPRRIARREDAVRPAVAGSAA